MNQQMEQNQPLELGTSIKGSLDSYTVISTLAKTEQSRVYLGISKAKGQKIVIKDYVNAAARGFERENYIYDLFKKQGKHDNIIPTEEFIITEENRKLGIFPYIAGETLLTRLKQKGSFIPRQTVSIVSSLCEAVEYIHNLGIVHRDVKPGNIMLPEDESPLKLFDFGISWHNDLKNLDEEREVSGTYTHMSPEILSPSLVVKGRDIYAVGVTLFQLLTGRVPFCGYDNIETLLEHVMKPIPDITEYNASVSEDLKAVVEKALAEKPEERYQNAAELKRDYLQAVR